MKKIYTFVTALLVGVSTQAQTVDDFEGVSLTSESFDNGSTSPSNFSMYGVTLNNSYDSQSGSWTGFAISNMTDVTTPGWTNQYSAYPGSGADSSLNYGIGYWSPVMTNMGTQIFQTFEITNTTYAYLSMRDGDGYGKEFGSPLDGNGLDDGTNGEDFYKVWIMCEGFGQIDSIEFYLADYRFADSAQDYIIDDWMTIDVTGIGFPVDQISFKFESSDNDPTWGIKTPAYFAIDNIVTETLEGLDELDASAFKVYPNPMNDVLIIEGETAEYHLLDINGRLLMNSLHENHSVLDTSKLPSGVYFVKMSTGKGQVTYKVIK